MNRITHRMAPLLALTLAGAALAQESFTPSTDWKEVVEPGEAELHQSIANEINEMQRKAAANGGAIDRGFHPKAHHVMRGQLIVRDDMPEFARVGVLASPRTYTTWVRFSNGSPGSVKDSARDVRGLAVKVVGVEGERLLPGDANTQDFLCINHEAQPARNIHQFMFLVRGASSPLTLPYKLAREYGVFESGRILGWMARKLARKTRSLVTSDFHTTLPHAFGAYAGKVSFVAASEDLGGGPTRSDDYLKEGLANHLRQSSLRYQMMVQFFVDEESTPIEDAATVWDESVSPRVHVADLVLEGRDLDSAEAKAEHEEGQKFSFTPWNGVAAHRPLGSLMRARKVVYAASAALRGAVTEPAN